MALDSGVNQFGPLVGIHTVDAAIIAHLQKWSQTYLNEIARQTGENFGRLTKIRNYRASSEIEFMPEDQRPCVVIVNNGAEDPPVKYGRTDEPFGQRVQITWEYQIGVQTVAQGRKQLSVPRAHMLSAMYMTAIRACLIQEDRMQDPDALPFWVDWKDEAPGGIASDAERTTAITIGIFNVTVPTALIWGTGPLFPETDPLPESPTWPAATTYHLEIIKVPAKDPMN